MANAGPMDSDARKAEINGLSSIVIPTVIALALVLASLLVAGVAIWDGSYQVRVDVVRQGELVPAREVRSIEYLTFYDQKECLKILESLEEVGDGELEKVRVAGGVNYIRVPTFGKVYCFGLVRTHNQYHSALIRVTLQDGRIVYSDVSISDRDRDQIIRVEAP